MIGYISADGKYHKEPDNHRGQEVDVASQYKDWSHDNQRRRMNGDIIQPYINGEVNREFVEVYKGDIANRYYSQEEQDKAMRRLS